MTTATNEGAGWVPEIDLADRLSRTLRETGIAVQEMADYMGVSRETIGRWINGRNRPSRAALMVWASRTGVDRSWLETGQASPGAVTPDEWFAAHVARSEGFEPPTFWFGVSRHLRLVWSVRESLTPELPLGLDRPRVLRAVS